MPDAPLNRRSPQETRNNPPVLVRNNCQNYIDGAGVHFRPFGSEGTPNKEPNCQSEAKKQLRRMMVTSFRAPLAPAFAHCATLPG